MKYAVLLVVAMTYAAAQDAHTRDGYFQYTNVKGQKQYEHGYNRGNPYHRRSHHQKNKEHTFQAKVTWDDVTGGQGEHYFDYNHGPKPAGYKEPAPYAPKLYPPSPYAPLPHKPAFR